MSPNLFICESLAFTCETLFHHVNSQVPHSLPFLSTIVFSWAVTWNLLLFQTFDLIKREVLDGRLQQNMLLSSQFKSTANSELLNVDYKLDTFTLFLFLFQKISSHISHHKEKKTCLDSKRVSEEWNFLLYLRIGCTLKKEILLVWIQWQPFNSTRLRDIPKSHLLASFYLCDLFTCTYSIGQYWE